MEQAILSGGARPGDIRADEARFAGRSAASWPAIFAGAAVAVSSSLVLLALGSGFGFASISPWPGRGVSATTFTVTSAIWLIVTQWISAALGGYIAGRLRTKWVGTHTHEVFFRDTAHGFVTWSVATLFVAAVLTGSVSSLVGGGAHALGSLASAGAPGPGAPGPGPMAGPGMGPGAGMMPGGLPAGPPAALTYDIDKLFRPGPGSASLPTAGAATGAAPQAPPGGEAGAPGPGNLDIDSDPRVEAVYIAFHAMASGEVPAADRAYLAARVAEETGISPADAQTRVDTFLSDTQAAADRAKAAADAARKGAAEASIYLALSMLVGAFIASVSAALGGRLRDEHL
ncbi:MAG: hypothetical protein ABSC32_20705 [Steroidobacteraceae bacterium]